MRVALITDGIYPYVIGGMQKHSFYIAKYLAKNKIYVDLFHFNNSEFDVTKLEFFTDEEKKFIRSIIVDFPKTLKFPGHYLYASYKYSESIFDLIRPELKNYHFIYTKGFTGWKLINEKHKGNVDCCKIGVKFHGYEMFQIAANFKSKIQQFILRPFVKQISLKADVVFSYGGKITTIIKGLGVNSTQIIEIPSGVEKTKISSQISNHNEKIVKFIFLGRYERRKGINELNKVIEKLVSEKLAFTFDFIGAIPEKEKIKDKKISYYGELRDETLIKDILKKADVLVCPSWSEGFPNVILEGMASGLAIIATDVGAVSAMVSDKNGWLIEPGDLNELEKSIKNAIKIGDNLKAKKEESLKLLNNIFNWDEIFEKLMVALK